MTGLVETPIWEPEIYQLEQDDVVLGGPDGIDNLQGKQLANRTAYLKQQVEQADTDLAAHEAAADPHPQYVTTPELDVAIAALVNSSPSTLDTLAELAAALGNDPNFATTLTNLLALKAPLASPALTGTPTAPTPAQFDNTTKAATTEFVQRALGNLRGFASVTASTTLGSAQLGTHVQIAEAMPSGQTITLPPLAGLPSGVGYWITNDSANSVAIKANGAENINPIGNSFSLLARESVFVFVQTGTQWNIFGAIAALGLSGLGVAQAYATVSGSRALGATYTNSTARPIFVSAEFSVSSAGSSVLIATVGGANAGRIDLAYSSTSVPLTFIVPAGATYSIALSSGPSVTIIQWVELR